MGTVLPLGPLGTAGGGIVRRDPPEEAKEATDHPPGGVKGPQHQPTMSLGRDKQVVRNYGHRIVQPDNLLEFFAGAKLLRGPQWGDVEFLRDRRQSASRAL